MSELLINKEIVENRKMAARSLEDMLEKATTLREQMNKISASTLISPKPAKLETLRQNLSTLCERLHNKVRLFTNGTVTIAVAGVEKSGKSTMLKSLTGNHINLPTDKERCTAVSCEILYAEEGEQEYLELVYYTPEELTTIVQEQLEFLRVNAPWKEGFKPELPELTSIYALQHYNLPTLDMVVEADRMKFRDALDSLISAQKALSKYANRLGTNSKAEVSMLARYASHETRKQQEIEEDQALIQKIIIHTHFMGGSAALRLCDTPGVNDPNPQALKRTLKGLREETDLLILLNRPGDKPDVTNELSDFIGRLKNVDIDAPILERTIFQVNWDKSQDEDGSLADLRREKVMAYETFRPENVYDRMDVTNAAHLEKFMEKVRSRLMSQLPRQDRELVQKLRDEWKTLQGEIRRDVYDEIKNIPVGVESLGDDYYKWFSRRHSGKAGFIDRLRKEFNTLTSKVKDHPALAKLNEEIKIAYKEGKDSINKYLMERVTPENCLDIKSENESPNDVFLNELSQKMSYIVKNITEKVVELGPIVQEEVYGVISRALNDGVVVANLCPGATPKEKLSGLCELLRKSARSAYDKVDQENISFIAENLEEFVNVGDQMSYITRHELRPALNLFDPLRWHQDRRQNNNDLAKNAAKILEQSDIPGAKEDIAWLKDITKSVPPPKEAFAKELVYFLTRVKEIGFKLIYAVVRPRNNDKILSLMEDFLGQASQSLATQISCEPGWYAGLKHKDILPLIFPERAQKVRRDSMNAKEYETIIENFEKALD